MKEATEICNDGLAHKGKVNNSLGEGRQKHQMNTRVENLLSNAIIK